MERANGFRPQYVEAAIAGEVARVAAAARSSRNDTLNRAAFNLASLGLAGRDIIGALRPAAEQAGLRRSEIYLTINSGMKAGRQQPRPVAIEAPAGGGDGEQSPMTPTNEGIAYVELARVSRNVALAGDLGQRLEAWHGECLRIGEYVRANELPRADAVDGLQAVAVANDLDELVRREGIEHVIS